MNAIDIILRVIITYAVLLILTRLMGRKEISQMTFFNFVSAITIGSIGANLAVNANLDTINGIIAIVAWAAATVLTDFANLRSIKARHLISGNPIIVIKDGKIIEKSLITARLNLDYLTALLREKNIFSVTEVDYAIFEINGKLTVLKKDVFVPLTKYDMKIPANQKKYAVPTTVISDGRLLSQNIRNLKLERNWLVGELKNQDVKDIKEVLFAQVQTDGSLFVEKKQVMKNTVI